MTDTNRYTLVVFRAPDKYTNKWNNFSVRGVPDFASQTIVRGNFPTYEAACDWAYGLLPRGAPFCVRELTEDEEEE